jgi:hypothetical protein
MAFILQNWGKVSVSANEPVSVGGVILGAPREFSYYTLDTQAVVSGTANYFSAVVESLFAGDIIRVYSATDLTSVSYIVTTASINPTSVVISLLGAGGIASGIISNAQMLAGIYAHPVQLIPPPGANKMIVVRNAVLSIVYNSVQYQNGGAIRFQYDSTIHGAGVNACATTVAAADINGATANNSQLLLGVLQAWGLNTTWANLGIYLSCATGEFTNGDSPLHYSVDYRIANLVSG